MSVKSRVLINCPKTGKPIFTGMLIREEAFESDGLGEHQVKCPHCGKLHTWQKEDAYLSTPKDKPGREKR